MKYFAIIILISIILSCDNKENIADDDVQIVKSENIDIYQRNFHQQQEATNKRLSGKINSLLNKACEYDSDKYENCMVLVVKNTDCQSCIDLGNDFIKSLHDKNLNKVLYVVGTSDLLSDRTNMKNKYIDTKQDIVEDLGFFKTPALISYNKSDGITDTYMIPVFDDSVGLGSFSQSIQSYLSN